MNRSGRNFLVIAVIIFLTALFPACRSSKSSAPAPGTDWTSVYLPVKVSLDKPTSFSLSGRATIERDRAMHISLRVLGMEVAWISVVNDSIFVVDKYHKYAFAEPLSTVLGSRYDKYTVTDLVRILFGLQSIEDNPYVTVTAENRTTSPAGDVAQRVIVDSDTDHGHFAGNVTWNFDEASWNDPNRHIPTPSISDKYRRINLEALRKALKSFKL